MRKGPLRWTVIFSIFLVGVGALPVAAQTPVADSVRALEEIRRQAIMRRDTVTMARLLADDFVEIGPGGQVFTKRDNLRATASGARVFTSLRLDSLVVQVYENTAVLRGIAHYVGTIDSNPYQLDARYTRVFVRRNGHWQAITQQLTRIEP